MKQPPYVPKPRVGEGEPWVSYGSDETTFYKWIPHICGVCCLKMVTCACVIARQLSLHELTMLCVEHGAFVERSDGEIDGLMHYPFARFCYKLGLQATVHRRLDIELLKDEISNGLYVMLSIELSRANPSFQGSHLILVYGFDVRSDVFWAHDPSSVVRSSGQAMAIPARELSNISNNRGISLQTRT